MTQEIKAKTIVSQFINASGWFGINYNMNIYKGCSHGCIYCDSRSDCYRIDGFDKVRVKADALQIIGKELKGKKKKGVIATGSMSDPYNPLEKTLRQTRGALELIDQNKFGVAVATKSSLAERDIDIFKKIKRHSPAILKITITAADDNLCKVIEPAVSLSSARFMTLEKFAAAGIFCGVLLMPLLPHITDGESNVKSIIERAADAGADFVYGGSGVTLRDSQRAYFFDKLDQNFPGVKEKYLKEFGNSYSCGTKSEKLWAVFKETCEKRGIKYRMKDIIAKSREPYQKEYEKYEQLSMFDS